MIKRVLCVLAAIMVASSSAMAWTAESFIGNDYDEQQSYDFEPVYDYPMHPMMMMSARSTSSLTTENLLTDLSLWDVHFDVGPAFIREYYYDYYIPNVGTTVIGPMLTANGIELNYSLLTNSGNIGFTCKGTTIPAIADLDDSSYASNYDVNRNWFNSYVVDYTYYFDSLSEFSSFELIYNLDPYCLFACYGNTLSFYDATIQILIDDVVIIEGRDVISSGSYIYNAFETPSSLTIRVIYDDYTSISPYNNSGFVNTWGGFEVGSFFNVNVIGRDAALDGFNNQAQDNINQHNAIESEWTGSMTSNFNALSIETFAFPSGLISAFGLITGIFNDLWNGMGEYKIAYVFPLTLGIALLLIGRISKFDGGQSSGKRNRGDDGA